MSLRRPVATLVAMALTVLAACESGPSGPTTVSGTVTGASDVGAVVLDVVWVGVQGFEGQGSTQVYSAPVAGDENRHRVILVAPSGGDLTFGILVDDIHLEGPIVTVVDATGTNDLQRPVGDLRVALEW